MAPGSDRDEDNEDNEAPMADERSPLMVHYVPLGESSKVNILPRIDSELTFVGSDDGFVSMVSESELDRPWPSTWERSIGLLSNTLISSDRVDLLTKSPKPGGPLFFDRLKRRGDVGTPDTIYSRTLISDGDDSFLKLQKIKSLDFDTKYPKPDLLVLNMGSRNSLNKRANNKAQKKKETMDKDSKATFSQCVFNMCNTLMGIGMLALPFAIASAGWVAGTLVLILCTCVTWWTCLLIGRTLNGDPRPTHFFDDSPLDAKLVPGSSEKARMRHPMTSLPQMAIESFGTVGNVVLSTVLYFELFSSLCIFLVTIGDHLYTLYPVISISTHTVIVSVILSIPTILLRTPRLLSYMSAVGTLATVGMVLSVVASAIIEGDISHQVVPEGTHSLWIPSGIMLSIGLVMFCYSGHAIVPAFYNSMEKPQEFETMLHFSYSVVLVCYIAVGVSGYYMFGSAVKDQITISLENESSFGSAMTSLTWLMVLTAFSKATLYIFPLSLGVEEIIAPHLSDEFAVRAASCVIKIAFIAFALLVSLFIPSFGFICALVGMICTMIVSVIFPAATHLQLFGHKLSTKDKVVDWIIISLGIVVAVTGTIATISNAYV